MTEPPCPFCSPPDDRLFHRGRLVLGLWDQFPVSPGHALIIPRRHVASWFDATDEERMELMAAVSDARRAIEQVHQPDGYNLGVNVGHAAGQTVFHLHVHVIPRYQGDVPAPRGGVRHVIPEKADYVGLVREAQAASYAALSPTIADGLSGPAIVRPPHWQALVQGGDDPLLPHLRAHLATAVRVGSRQLYRFAKSRWEIENEGFNDGKTRYGMEHIRHHHANSVLVMWLLTIFALTIERLYRLRYLHRGRHRPATPIEFLPMLRLSLGSPRPLDTG